MLACPCSTRGRLAPALACLGSRQKHSLPDLPYDYGALEPHINAQIMELHHSKHHAAYVNNLNVTEDKYREALAKGGCQANGCSVVWPLETCVFSPWVPMLLMPTTGRGSFAPRGHSHKMSS